jgi:cytochrome P450 PksS
VNLIGTGALVVMQNPDQKKNLNADPESAVEELLRFTSPADFATPRIAREDVVIRGTTIPRGAMVLAALGSANRDPAQFSNPDTLDLTRQPNRHLAFGMGIHFCVGAPLARMEGQIALTRLFQRFPNLRLARPDALRWRRGMLLRGLEELPVST